MNTTEALLCASRLAERQPTVTTAIAAALAFADRIPDARAAVSAAAARRSGVLGSPALTLPRTTGSPHAVAEFFLSAAGGLS